MIDRHARQVVGNALSGFVQGRILTKAFAQTVTRYQSWSDATADGSVKAICDELYSLYDDFRDEPIDVAEDARQALMRTLAFLQTNLEYEHGEINSHGTWESVRSYWPFANETDWLNHKHLRTARLFDFDPDLLPKPQSTWAVLVYVVAAVFVGIGVLAGGILLLTWLLAG